MQEKGLVGVFDSGVGGLSVLQAIQKRLPALNLLYLADSAHAPYGELSVERILQRSEAATRFLLQQGASAIVVACNTATAVAVEHLRSFSSCPVIAIEPAIKPAVELSRTGTVGVLATRATLASPRYAALLARYGSRTRVIARACPGLVEHVEQGDWQSEAVYGLLRGYIAPLLSAGVDQLVLGCTHYPFLQAPIRALAGPDVAILDTGPAVAAELERRLRVEPCRQSGSQGTVHFFTSGIPEQVLPVMQRLWPGKVVLESWQENPA